LTEARGGALPSDRVFRQLVTIILTMATFVSAGVALASQGTRVTTSFSYNGTRSNIKKVTLSVPGGSGAIMSVRSQSSVNSSSSGLFQTGYIKQNSITTDCGGTFTGLMVEWRSVGGIYYCSVFSGGGTNDRFAVVAISTATWQAYFNGSPLGSAHNVSYDTGYVFAVGEWVGVAQSSVNSCFGCDGTTHWQSSTSRGSSYQDVTASNSTTAADPGWTVGTPPSPFSIYD